MARIWRLLAGLAAVALFLFALIAVNQEEVSVRFLVWRTPQWSLFWWLLIAFSVGLGVGVLAALPSRIKGVLRQRKAN